MIIPYPDSLLALLKVQDISVHALRLGNEEEGHDSAQNTTGKEDPEDVSNANFSGSTQVVEEHA